MNSTPKLVRMIDLVKRHSRVAENVEESVVSILRSGQYTGGPFVTEAEHIIAKSFGRQYGVGVASGTDALILGLLALGIMPGDEVIIPALSFFATAGAVLSIGATPIIVDVQEDACIDPDLVKKAITQRTKAIIPVHLYGNYAKLPELGLPILDDSAQAIGGQPARSYGALSAVSVYPTKTLGSAGSGGFIVGDDPQLIDTARRLGQHGYCSETHEHLPVNHTVGRNSRLDAIQAAVLIAHASDLPRRVERRQAIANYYDSQLADDQQPLQRHPGSPVHQYILLSPNRDRLEKALNKQGIETRRYYSRPLHREPALPGSFSCPTADHLCQQLLALPVHAELEEDEITFVAHHLNEERITRAS